MTKFEIIFSILFILCFQAAYHSQETPETIHIGHSATITVTKEGIYYTLEIRTDDINVNTDKFIAISTTPQEFHKPAYIYMTFDDDLHPSPDNRKYSSQELGRNILYLKGSDYAGLSSNKKLNLFIKSLEETNIKFEVYKGSEINLEDYQLGMRHKIKLSLVSDSEESNITHFKFNKTFSKERKILFYSLAEHFNYTNLTVELVHINGQKVIYEAKQIFENGYGAIVNIGPTTFNQPGAIYIRPNIDNTDEDIDAKNRKVEVGYEIIDNALDGDGQREVDIFEHVYGMAQNSETCYKVREDSLFNKTATMLLNIYSQSVSFRIKNKSNSVIYTLDVNNNYFIKLPKEFYDPDNYFCFKHITPHESEIEIYGEVSYDFQIYYDDELSKYQMFIMPLISGKIYTHSLNRGDIIIYRNNFYGNYTEGNEKVIYSANMLRIRGNPKSYGFTCERYPDNCAITAEDLKNKEKVEEILPLNMYSINKRLNAEGNTKIDENDATCDLRKQYMTIVSCESDEKDPNAGECKYNIEINNERDEIQLMPETVFATSIFGKINYFLIRLKDYANTKSLKLYFTVLTGNAELYIYDDWLCTNEVKDYKFSHIHRKEIIEIDKDLKENYYLNIVCSGPSFIQLKYETDAHDKGYNNLMPNEVNLVPINNNTRSYYNMYNPNYYFPLNNEIRNNDFYFRIETMDCSMHIGNTNGILSGLNKFEEIHEKNKLYDYLSSYGFVGQIDQNLHTSSKDELCGLIISNGEKSEKSPLLITSDMPHNSTFEFTYYVFPIIYDKDNDQGIIIEFNLYNIEGSTENDLYEIVYAIKGNNNVESKTFINKNTVIYIDKGECGLILDKNIIGNLYITIHKKYPDRKYYITTNIISSKISPEYISTNQKYQFNLRPSSSKYFYSSVSKDTEGHIKFDHLPNDVGVYCKIVQKDIIEKNYNWNKRVKLPELNDENLLVMKDGLIKYTIGQTSKCTAGCEIYFHIKSDKQINNVGITVEDLISISFEIEEKIHQKDNETDDNTGGNTDGGETKNEEGSNVWIIIVVVFAVLIIVIIVLVLILRKKRVYSTDITMNAKEINELSMPLE